MSNHSKTKIYNKKFYDGQGNRSINSAEIIIPLIFEILSINPLKTSVIDLGCGIGSWLSVFEKYGCGIKGVDGNNVNSEALLISKENFIFHDLTKPLDLNKKFDIAISLEVAEHLSNDYAENFVKTLASLSDIVIFSAAIPFQVGINHVNCQWPSYWISIWKKYNYLALDCIREKIWLNETVAPYYAQNIFLFVKENDKNIDLINNISSSTNGLICYDLINPRYWEQFNNIFYIKFFNYLAKNPVLGKIYRTFANKKK